MSDQNESEEQSEVGADTVAILYILGGIPAIVSFIVILFALTNVHWEIPA